MNKPRVYDLMEHSTTYQAILRWARTDEARRLLLLQGEQKFGPPDALMRSTIENCDDLDLLEKWALRLLSARDWCALFALRPFRLRQRRSRR
jgi:hypothetical protein